MLLNVSELTRSDLLDLYNKALIFNGRASTSQCRWFYRNRSPKYFEHIWKQRGGIMEVYHKDNSGDQASAINGQIKGLFFMAKNINGAPPPKSQFGSVRLQVPAEVLLGFTPNVYFADFYCMRGATHYVTLVMTRPCSSSDEFCRGRLLPVDLYDSRKNPFLFRHGAYLYTTNKQTLCIEVLYTENININYLVQHHEAKLLSGIPPPKGCKGRSTVGGIPKNPLCRQCNVATPVGRFISL